MSYLAALQQRIKSLFIKCLTNKAYQQCPIRKQPVIQYDQHNDFYVVLLEIKALT
jgi:hypothetical protein